VSGRSLSLHSPPKTRHSACPERSRRDRSGPIFSSAPNCGALGRGAEESPLVHYLFNHLNRFRNDTIACHSTPVPSLGRLSGVLQERFSKRPLSATKQSQLPGNFFERGLASALSMDARNHFHGTGFW